MSCAKIKKFQCRDKQAPDRRAVASSPKVRIVQLRQYARELSRLGKGTGFRASLKAGVFGGSFDPVHAGHIAIAKYASERLLLGRVLWVLAQASPAKDSLAKECALQNKNIQNSFNARLALARRALECGQGKTSTKTSTKTITKTSTRKSLSTLDASRYDVSVPKELTHSASTQELTHSVSALEKKLDITHTHELAEAMTKAFPKINLVFLMGADSFAQFKRWKKWQRLAKYMTLAVFARKGSSLQARMNVAAKRLPRIKQGWQVGRKIAEAKPPRWAFVPMQNVTIASSNMREDRKQLAKN